MPLNVMVQEAQKDIQESSQEQMNCSMGWKYIRNFKVTTNAQVDVEIILKC